MTNQKQKSLEETVENNNSKSGHCILSFPLLIAGALTSIVSGTSAGFSVGSGLVNDPLASNLVGLYFPGPIVAAFGGIMMHPVMGLAFGAVCAGIEVASFGVGYGIGYLTKWQIY